MTCWSCQSDLREGQKLCSECGSWQNWRRHFNFSAAMVAAVAGLLSILVVVVPVIANWIDTNDELTVEIAGYHSADWTSITFEVQNTSSNPLTFPTLLNCFEVDPPDERSNAAYTYQARSQPRLDANSGAEIVFAFSGSFNTNQRDSIDIGPTTAVRCQGGFRDFPNHRVKIQFRHGSLFTFWLERDFERYYP